MVAGGGVCHGFMIYTRGKILFGSVPLEEPFAVVWASSSVRIEHQPSKLRVKGSNPFPPATNTLLEPNSVFNRSTFTV